MEKDQYEYQRSVIRDEYITEQEIDDRLADRSSVQTASQMRRGRKAGFRRVEKKVGKRLPAHGKVPKGEIIGGGRAPVQKL